MTDEAPRCAGCGALLPAAEAICPRCERELSPPEAKPARGTYRCPACRNRFGRPEQVWWPLDAPWYWPQTAKARCPHGRTVLHDRQNIRRSSAEPVVLAAAVIASAFSPWRPGTQIVLLVVFSGVEFIRWRRVHSSIFEEEDRYAVEAPNR